MSKLPVSVQICTLNESSNIEEVIRSAQSNFPDEILVIDGGSTDETVEKARQMGVRVIEVGSIGLAAQRQKGVSSTTQPYIAIVDADDRLDPNFLNTLLFQLKKNGYAAIDGISKPLSQKTYWQKGWANYILTERTVVSETIMVVTFPQSLRH